MSIWRHSDTVESDFLSENLWGPNKCCFCGTPMTDIDLADYWPRTDTAYLSLYQKQMLGGDPPAIEMMGIENNPESWRIEDGSPSEMYVSVAICPACGWWSVIKQAALDAPQQIWDLIFRAEGALRSLDIGDISHPVNDVRSFLMAKYGQRFKIHPRKFEEVVTSVFSNMGYQAAVTAYSRDGGIDVILHGPGEELIGVQVKRYKNSIEVEQIRSFVGALLLGRFVKGIFVTTSRYQSGAPTLARQSSAMGIPIELIDEQAFFEALRVAQLVGTNPIQDFIGMLQSDDRPQLTYAALFHRNSL